MLIQAPNTNLVNGTVKAVLLSAAYTYSDDHQYLSDVLSELPSEAHVAASDALIGASVAAVGPFNSDVQILQLYS